MTELLSKNLAAVRATDPELAERLKETEPSPEVEIEETKTGDVTLRYRKRYFHSRYDPWKEAERHFSEIGKKDADWVVLFGVGCGYLLRKIAADGEKKVLAFEPDPAMLRAVLSAVDLSDVLARDNVFLCADLPAASYIVRDRVDGMDTLVGYQTGPYRQAFPERLVEFTRKIDNAHTTTKVAIKTDIDSRPQWVENYLDNLEHFAECPPVDVLRDRFRGLPMVIVGAGPSLKKNAHLLKKIKGRAVIVAAITAYKAVLDYGVVPDFLISAEKIDLPHYFTGTDVDKDVRLILGDVSHPGLFNRETGRKFVFYNAYISLSTAQAKLWGSDYFASIGGSVTTAALDMGIMFGCPQVIFIGQDLAYGDGESHAGGGVYEAGNTTIDARRGVAVVDLKYAIAEEKQVQEHRILWLKGLNGKPVPSKFDWVTFHQWFENYMEFVKKEKIQVEVINATEGGAWIEGMEHMTLAEAVERHVGDGADIDGIIEKAVAERAPVDVEGLENSFKEITSRLRYIKKLAGRIVKEARRMKKVVRSQGLTGELRSSIERIKKTEDAIFDEMGENGFIAEYLSPYRYRLEEFLRDEKDDGSPEFFKKNLDFTMETYRNFLEMCSNLTPLFERAGGMMEGLRKKGRTSEITAQKECYYA